MKTTRLAIIAMALLLSLGASAQTATTNMLEMSPYRHQSNPALEPITRGYFYFPVLSHLSLGLGNNSLAMNDIIVNQGGKTMWTLNPDCTYDLLGAFRNNTLVQAQVNTAILGFGTRTKKGGYLHINIDAHVDAGVNMPKGLVTFALGEQDDLNAAHRSTNLKSLGGSAQAYLSLGVGYSRTIGEHWTIGVKVKLIDGLAYAGIQHSDLQLETSMEQWALQGKGSMAIAGPFNPELRNVYPASASFEDLAAWAQPEDGPLVDVFNVGSLLTPSGYGGAVDLGFSWKPIRQLRFSGALTDVGAICWTRGRRMGYDVNGTFEGFGTINYADYTDEEGNFDGSRLGDTLSSRMQEVLQTSLHANDDYHTADGEWKKTFASPLTMKMNLALDATFCRDIIGLGLYSTTSLYNSKLYEELTVGAALRPCTWFNLAISYSVLNGRWGNIGAALGLRGGPFALTLAADYIPTSYATYPIEEKINIGIPYKTQGFNFEMGLNIVWGWKPKAPKAEEVAAEYSAL